MVSTRAPWYRLDPMQPEQVPPSTRGSVGRRPARRRLRGPSLALALALAGCAPPRDVAAPPPRDLEDLATPSDAVDPNPDGAMPTEREAAASKDVALSRSELDEVVRSLEPAAACLSTARGASTGKVSVKGSFVDGRFVRVELLSEVPVSPQVAECILDEVRRARVNLSLGTRPRLVEVPLVAP